ncbi:MAG TPA: T9SS type A sorting domain-containing protein [Flavobacteriia bacterium]|nr:T9SS type A sorting domain-containing protein [Flavobacteriia bacterium]
MNHYFTIFLLFIPYSIQANTYYVAPNGNNASQGTENQPWKTIQKAANTLTAGDTVLIKAGIYNERVIVKNSGTLHNYIVYTHYRNDQVIIDGTGISWGSNWNGLFDISDKNYIQVIGLTLKNSDYAAVFIDNSTHIIIKNNTTYNTYSSGIGVWNSNTVTLENNEVELACNDGGEECISIANSNNCDILNNNIHNNGPGTNGGEGIDIKEGSFNINIYQNTVHHLNNRLGIYADAWDLHTHHINIYQNTVHHCSESGIAMASESGGLLEYVTIFNNIVYNNKYGGIELGAWSDIGFTGLKPIKHIQIINNTCYQNGSYNNGWGYGIVIDNPDAEDVTIRNNICSNNSAQIAIKQIKSQGVVDHNLFYGNNTASGTLYGDYSILQAPLFVDSSTDNFHLRSDSPAIDNGNSIDAPNVDFENNNRPSGMDYDIGAYEYTSVLNTNDNILPKVTIKLYPNPAKNKITVKINGLEEQNYILKLMSLKGQLLKTIIMKNNIIIIKTDELSTGMYILKIVSEDTIVSTKKMIIQ